MNGICIYNAIAKADDGVIDRAYRSCRAEEVRKRKRKQGLIFAAAAAALCVTVAVCTVVTVSLYRDEEPAPGTQETAPGVQDLSVYVQWEAMTLDQTIDASSCIFYGKCVGKSSNSPLGTARLTFEIEKVYKGSYDPQVRVFGSLLSNPFVEGGEYLLFCGRDASVYSGEDSYGISRVICDTTDGLYHDGVFDMKLSDLSSVCAYVEAYTAEHPSDNAVPISGDYCRSEDLKEIYDYASTVAVVKITGIRNDLGLFADDRTSYTFETKDVLKGTVKKEEWVVAFKDSMNVGEEYLLLMDKPDDTSAFFIMCSPKSVIPAASEDAEYIYSIK